MNKLSTEKRAQAVAALVEGNSVRATIRMTGVAKNTIQKLRLELGAARSAYLDRPLRNLKSKRVQIDEILVVSRGEANEHHDRRLLIGVTLVTPGRSLPSMPIASR